MRHGGLGSSGDMLCLATWLKPEDVEPTLRLLALMETYGQIRPREAEAPPNG